MYRKILVPLDGSGLAECTLPHVKQLVSRRELQTLILLRVVETEHVYIPKAYTRSFDFGALERAYVEEATAYLERVGESLKGGGFQVQTAIVKGQAAEVIVDYARQNGVDLIAITTHGRTGLSQVVFGSVALRVLHSAHSPVLLIQPLSCR